MVHLEPPALLGVCVISMAFGIFALLSNWSVLIVYAALFIAIGVVVVGYARWVERNEP
jgi:hypothetical protein